MLKKHFFPLLIAHLSLSCRLHRIQHPNLAVPPSPHLLSPMIWLGRQHAWAPLPVHFSEECTILIFLCFAHCVIWWRSGQKKRNFSVLCLIPDWRHASGAYTTLDLIGMPGFTISTYLLPLSRIKCCSSTTFSKFRLAGMYSDAMPSKFMVHCMHLVKSFDDI